MKYKKIIFTILTIAVLGSCNKMNDKFDRLLNNPNSPTPESANADLYLTNIQFGFASFFNSASSFGMELTRQILFYGPTYGNGYTAVSYDGMWNTAYTNIIKNANALIPIAEQQKKFVNVGMAKIMKAYTYMTLVDMFGDIPFSEANLGVDNTNPKLDKGQEVYAASIKMLDEAIADLAKTPASFPGNQDLYYGAANAAGARRWVTLAKTLKLRAFLQTRLVDAGAKGKIDALLTENDLIDTQAEDFEFKYSTKQAAPNSRHPRYNSNYSPVGSASDYISNYFMFALIQEKGTGANNDPRTRYYIYRQRTNYADVNQNSSSCSVSAPPAHYTAGIPFCLLITGYWGRDHGDNSGIPPDGPLRSTVGIYPFGGEFDANQGTSVSLNRGGQGAGIQPILLATFTEFMKAEAALILGTAGNPRTLLESGIRSSFAKVFSFPATVGVTVPSTFVPDQARQDAYVNKVLALYDGAGSTDQKMEVLIKEYWLALWGNGSDAYNTYRRTGKPATFQPTRSTAPGEFIRSHLYPSVHVNLNQNSAQKSGVGVRVFWDTNPPGFIK